MIKTLHAIEKKIGERVYRLTCEGDSPLGEVHDVLSQMKHYVIQRINEAHEAEKPVEPEVKQE